MKRNDTSRHLRRSGRIVGLLVGLALLPVASDASAAAAADPSYNGLIAFSRQSQWSPGDGVDAIFVVAPGGGTPRRVTPDGFWGYPVWSPEGTRIAFKRRNQGIWVVALDGSAPRQLSNNYWDTDAKWSPDASKVLFHRDDASLGAARVYVTPAAGGPLTEIGEGFEGSWSPDGQRVVFDAISGLKVAPATGGNAVQITSGRHFSPEWSAAANLISFTQYDGGATYSLWTVNADGSSLRKALTTDQILDHSWSSDGSRILIHATTGISVLQVATGVVTPITNRADQAAWSPDGTRIVLRDYSEPNGPAGISSYDARGGGRVVLTADRRYGDGHPSWQPARSFFNGRCQIPYGETETNSSVARLYKAYFLRDADSGGLNYWVPRYRSGQLCLTDISEYFAQSNEFVGTYGNLDNPRFVRLVYINVLGREPDPDGYNFWAQKITYGGVRRGTMMVGFSESPEFRSRSGIA